MSVAYLNRVEQYEAKFGRDVTFDRARKFMIAYLTLGHAPLPTVARDALAIAARFCDGDASADDLIKARIRCWDFLGPQEQEVSKPERPAVRAVICALYDQYADSPDAVFLLDFFLFWANK